MENLRKRSVINLVIWVFASVDLYALSFIGHLPIARLAAFIALLVSVLTFLFAYRSTGSRLKLQINISASATIVAGILYLIQSGWKP